MTFHSLLVNTCVIERYTLGADDGYGNMEKVWTTHLTEPCRLSFPSGRQAEGPTEVVPVDALLFLEDVDVTEHDRARVDGDLFQILFVGRVQDSIGHHHKELSLKKVIP